MASRFLILGSAAVVLFTAACAHQTDVPVPADPQAEAWAPVIKESYPGWQPPAAMPKGNAEYNQIFQKTDRKAAGTMILKIEEPQRGAPIPASAAVQLKPTPAPVPDLKPAPEPEKTEKNVTEPDRKTAPLMVRIDVLKDKKEAYLVNGIPTPDASVKVYLLDMGKLNRDFAVKIYMPDQAPEERLTQLKDFCKEAEIHSIAVFTQEEVQAAQKEESAKLCIRLPETVEGQFTDYKIQKNDSLSRIALKQYRHAAYWPLIFKANYEKLKGNPDTLKVGTVLQIPVLKTDAASAKTAK